MFAFSYCDTQYHIKIDEKIIIFIFSNICIKTSEILFHHRWFDSHVSWKIQIIWFTFVSKKILLFRNFSIFDHLLHIQSRIIFYFMFAINQKTSISQISKSSNSKNFQKHTFAKTIRFVLSEKSIYSSYELLNIFYVNSKTFANSNFSKMKFSKHYMFAKILRVNSFLFVFV